MYDQIECPTCNKVGVPSGDYVMVGSARVDLIQGLDPKNCHGCWDAMQQSGIAPGTYVKDGSVREWQPFPRPTE